MYIITLFSCFFDHHYAFYTTNSSDCYRFFLCHWLYSLIQICIPRWAIWNYYFKKSKNFFNFKRIASNYVMSWFIIDLLSFLPFILVLDLSYKDVVSQTTHVNLQMLKLMRLFKLAKLIKDRNKFFLNMSHHFRLKDSLCKLLFFLLLCFTFLHFAACFWIFISLKYNYDES